MGWPSQADFVLCFRRTFGIGVNSEREAFTCVFTHEGYYIIQMNNNLVKVLKNMNVTQLNEVAKCFDKVIDKYQIEEHRIANKVKSGRHAYSMNAHTKVEKINMLTKLTSNVTLFKVLKHITDDHVKHICKHDLQMCFCHFTPYNESYNSRKSVDNKVFEGKSLNIRKSVFGI